MKIDLTDLAIDILCYVFITPRILTENSKYKIVRVFGMILTFFWFILVSPLFIVIIPIVLLLILIQTIIDC